MYFGMVDNVGSQLFYINEYKIKRKRDNCMTWYCCFED